MPMNRYAYAFVSTLAHAGVPSNFTANPTHFLSQNLLSHGSPFLGITIFLIYKL